MGIELLETKRTGERSCRSPGPPEVPPRKARNVPSKLTKAYGSATNRAGVGYTLNFGRPASWAILLAITAAPLIVIRLMR